MAEQLSINIRIGNREYPMKVNPEEEEHIRKVGKILNDKIKRLQDQFNIEEMKDLIALVAFECLEEKLKNEKKHAASEEAMFNKISKLSNLLNKSI